MRLVYVASIYIYNPYGGKIDKDTASVTKRQIASHLQSILPLLLEKIEKRCCSYIFKCGYRVCGSQIAYRSFRVRRIYG